MVIMHFRLLRSVNQWTLPRPSILFLPIVVYQPCLMLSPNFCCCEPEQEDGSAKAFRYEVYTKTRAMVFTPKQLNLAEIDTSSVRGTMLGACFDKAYDLIPDTTYARVCWEVALCALVFFRS